MQLQQELERLTPVDTNDLERAADLLDNFTAHWEQCANDMEVQHRLIKQIVERVYVRGEEVVAMTLHSNCHLVLGYNVNGPTEYSVGPFIQEASIAEAKFATCGPDESRSRTWHRRVVSLPKHIVKSCLPQVAFRM
jgi:hypothetical protein